MRLSSTGIAGQRPNVAIVLGKLSIAAKTAAENRDRQRVAKARSAFDAGGRAGADPDWKAPLRGARRDFGLMQCGARPARPRNALLRVDFCEEAELFGKEGVVILQIEAKERKALGECAAPEDQFHPPIRNQIGRCKFLEGANRIRGAEKRDCRGHRICFVARAIAAMVTAVAEFTNPAP